MAAQL